MDTDFAGNWDRKDTENPDTATSRHGYKIKFMGCPIIWKSQLQQEIAPSSTESDYTGLLYALGDAIPVMTLVQEMHSLGFILNYSEPKVYCHVYEDNSGVLEIAKVHKYRPRRKHLNLKLHISAVMSIGGDIKLHAISTNDQQANYLTMSDQLTCYKG